MANRQKPSKKPELQSSRLGNLVGKHKALTVAVCIGLALVSLVGVVKYTTYMNKFSDKDYAQIETMVEKVFTAVGAKDVAKNESCSYEAPGDFGNNRLYCSIQMAAYMPYESDEQAITTAKILEGEITHSFGSHFYGFSNFYKQPSDGSDVTVVTLKKPLPKEQCNFYIDSNKNAKDAANFLPERTEDNLIALSFECSGESRKPYFPVTYRQGR